MAMDLSSLLNLAHYAAAGTGQAVCSLTNNQTCPTGLPAVNAGPAELTQLLQIFFGIIAVVAVLMLVVAGLRYVTAQGNPQELEKARGTILYSLVGLVVALVAEAIVSLVLTRLANV